MKVQFSDEELRLLRIWGSNAIAGGHWGDGDLMLGEETVVLKKLAEGQIESDWNMLEIRVLYFWVENQKRNPLLSGGSETAIRLMNKIHSLYGNEPVNSDAGSC